MTDDILDPVLPPATDRPEEKHSPLPWRQAKQFGMGIGMLLADERDGVGVTLVASTPDPDDAAFIVTAVNSHQALVEALKAIAEGCSFPDDDVQRAVRDRARTALARVDERSRTAGPGVTTALADRKSVPPTVGRG